MPDTYHPTDTARLQPTAAERVLSASRRAPSATLAVSGAEAVEAAVHYVLGDGNVAIVVGADAFDHWFDYRDDDLAAVLELTDLAPGQIRHPVRSLVWLRGEVQVLTPTVERAVANAVAVDHPAPGLLDVGHSARLVLLEVDSAVLADRRGAVSVARGELAAAEPDLFCQFEADWIEHMNADHPEVLTNLARHIPAGLRCARLHLLGIDRYGLTLRAETRCGDQDIRLGFTQCTNTIEELSAQVQHLLEGTRLLARRR